MYKINPYVTRLQISNDAELWYNPLNQKIMVLDREDLVSALTEKPNKKLINSLFVIRCKENENESKTLARIWNSVSSSYSFKPNIEVAYFIMTEGCNLACKYCFIKRGAIKHGIPNAILMPAEVIDRGLGLFALFAKHAEEPTINLYGGEPLLNRKGVVHFIEQLERMKAKGTMPANTTTNIVTNGSLLDEDIISLIKKHKVMLSISLDGPPKLNDKMRVYPNGRGSSDVIIKNIKRLAKIGLRFTVSCSITEYNFDKLDETVRYFIEEFGCKEISLNMPMVLEKFRPDSSLMAEKMLHAYEVIKSYGGSEDRFSRILRPLIEGGIRISDCAGCGGQIVISPSGFIGPCHAYLGFKEGHFEDFGLLKDDLNGVKKRIEKSELFQSWAQKSPLLSASCESCKVFSLCGGGRYHFAEKYGLDKDEHWCAYVKAASTWALNHIAAGEKFDMRKETEKVFRTRRAVKAAIKKSITA